MFQGAILLSCKSIIYKIEKRVKRSDFTRLLPDYYNLQKKNRRNLLRYSGWGGMWGSNPRHSEPQSDALPTELRPP